MYPLEGDWHKPCFCGAAEVVPTPSVKRCRSISAAAPMVVVKICRAIGQRLLWMFACGCGALLSAFLTSSAPAQRQLKENDGVLTKGFPFVSGVNPKDFDAPFRRIFFGGSTPFLLYAIKRNGVEKKCFSVFAEKSAMISVRPADAPLG